jgi:hypothetical protein
MVADKKKMQDGKANHPMMQFVLTTLNFAISDLPDDIAEHQVRQARKHPPDRHLLRQAVPQPAAHGSPLQAPLQEHPLLR